MKKTLFSFVFVAVLTAFSNVPTAQAAFCGDPTYPSDYCDPQGFDSCNPSRICKEEGSTDS